MHESIEYEVMGEDRDELVIAVMATLAAFLGHAKFDHGDIRVRYSPQARTTGDHRIVRWRADVEYAGPMGRELRVETVPESGGDG